MKIVCDACGAKYSIADEKVAGKVFKIRCKRCSNIIVVRGDAEQAAEAAEPAADGNLDQKETRVFDYSGYDNPSDAAAVGDDAVWHVVIDQEQVGPMTVAEVGQRFAAGEVDADSYVWQEGFADWERLADVGEFASLVAGGGAPADDGNMFGGPPVDASETAENDPADLFAAAAGGAGADPGADLFSGGEGAAAGSDLFGAGEEAGGAGADPGGGALAGVAASEPDEPKLKGQRNENSVLFSLSNLASLAGDSAPASSSSSSSSPSASPAPAPSGGPAAAGAAAPGSKTTATQEGSGLIDIRSMAQVYLSEGESKAAPAGVGSDADIPSFSATSFDAPASPMLLPTAPAQDDNKKLLFILLGVIGALSLIAVILVVMVLSGDDEEEVASAGGDDTSETGSVLGGAGGGDDDPTGTLGGEGSGDSAEEGGDADETASGDDDSGEDDGKSGDDDTGETETAATKTTKTTTSGKSRDKKPKTKTRDNKPKTTTTTKKPDPTPKPTSSGCDEVTCLVEPNKACCRKYRSSKGKSGGGSNLKERPSKSDVKSGISRVMGRVRACGSKHGGGGLVKVRVKVAKSGRVASARPSPGGALGNCVSSAVRRARFPKTKRGVTFTYPFRF